MESDEQSDGQSYQLDLTPVEDDVSPVVIEKKSPKLRMPSFSLLVKFKMYRAVIEIAPCHN